MTVEEKEAAMESLIFLIEKRNGKVKSRMCGDGSKQRRRPGYKKEDGASPTVSTDGVVLTAMIEAWERRARAIMDIPGAFLHANCEDGDTYMLLRGRLAELMVLVDPKLYSEHVRHNEYGDAKLYVKLSKALYGMLKSALWFYGKLRKDLEAYGFKVNPYDPCVANAEINGSQMTVTWHVDDLKVSHADEKEIDKFADYLRGIYEKAGLKLTDKRGDVHDYLGMDLDYSTPGVVRISMIKYLDGVLNDFSEDLGGPAPSPAASHLFHVRDEKDAARLDAKRAKEFHTKTAQLLFLSARARRDIQLAVAFLTTRVKQPDEDDWGKLRRVLKYLKGTKHMKLTLSIDDMNTVRWWVDASDRTHEDCKGHTGSMMSLGKGAAISGSRKIKINTKSSTESELVALDDVLPTILWTLYFVEAQGYTIEQNLVFQDNLSTIRLATNGPLSSSPRTKHIKARYYFIKDKIDEGEVEMQYCPTEKMWCNVLNKPKQGSPFLEDRSMLMNVPVKYDDEEERKITHKDLLPQPEDDYNLAFPELKQPEKASRSVLGDIGNKKRDRAPGTERSKDGGKTVSWSELVRGGEQKMVRL